MYDASEVMDMNKVQPIRKLEQITRIRRNLKTEKTAAIYTAFVLGINTNLRISDMLGLTWGDVWEDDTRTLREHITLREEKTEKTRRIKITETMAEALNYLLANLAVVERKDSIIRNPVTRKVYSREHISRRLGIEAKKVGIQDPISAHSLRKTWGYQAIVTFHQPLTIVQAAFNHASQGQTMDYLCITDDEIEVVYDAVAL